MIPNDALCESMDKARTIKESGHGIGRSKIAEVMLFCKNAVALEPKDETACFMSLFYLP
jgi:hypothetical protein